MTSQPVAEAKGLRIEFYYSEVADVASVEKKLLPVLFCL
jgi:hypothetical protein